MFYSWRVTRIATGEEVARFASSKLAFKFIQDDIIAHWKNSTVDTADEWCALNIRDLCESYEKDKNFFEGGCLRAQYIISE